MTYTYAVLPVSPAAFEEIKAKLRAGGYEDAFHEGATLIDMHGIAIQAEAVVPPPDPAEIAAVRARHAKFQEMYSPGRDWQPAENAHADRATLLAYIDSLERIRDGH